ncbi:MAG: hypothetical protein HOV94_23995, partial [Saccharothrix sp.]|nr:hypothetical protein [Saccharothrix sp.]
LAGADPVLAELDRLAAVLGARRRDDTLDREVAHRLRRLLATCGGDRRDRFAEDVEAADADGILALIDSALGHPDRN